MIAAATWLERLSYRARRRRHRAVRRPPRRTSPPRLPPGRAAQGAGHPELRRHRGDHAARPRETTYRRELGIGGKTVVMYAGNVGFSQSLELMLAAATPARRPTPTSCSWSTAAGRPGRASRPRPPGCPTCASSTYQPKERLAEVLATGDVHVVPLKRGLAAVERARRRRTRSWPPAAPSWPASTRAPRSRAIVEQSGAGVSVPPDDPEAFTRRCPPRRPHPDELGPDGRRGPALRRAMGVARRRRRRVRGPVRRSCAPVAADARRPMTSR